MTWWETIELDESYEVLVVFPYDGEARLRIGELGSTLDLDTEVYAPLLDSCGFICLCTDNPWHKVGRPR